MNTNPVENKTFMNKVRNFMFGNKKANGANARVSASSNGNKSFMNKTKNFMFGNKKANGVANGANGANAIATPEASGSSSVRIIVFVFLFLLIGFIVSYLTVMTIKYLTMDCLNKKSLKANVRVFFFHLF